MKLKTKTLISSWYKWFIYNLAASNFNRLEGTNFGYAMTPVLKELYENNPSEYRKALKRHLKFYNTEPHVGVLVNGYICSLEEKRAGGADVSEEMIQSNKIGMMGPLAGIGDIIIPGIIIPVLLAVGMDISKDGSILGPLFYIITFIPLMIAITFYLFFNGYNLGKQDINILVTKKLKTITSALVIVGITVMGGVTASFVQVDVLTNAVKESQITSQSLVLILIPTLVFFIKKGKTPIKITLVLALIIFTLVVLGVV